MEKKQQFIRRNNSSELSVPMKYDDHAAILKLKWRKEAEVLTHPQYLHSCLNVWDFMLLTLIIQNVMLMIWRQFLEYSCYMNHIHKVCYTVAVWAVDLVTCSSDSHCKELRSSARSRLQLTFKKLKIGFLNRKSLRTIRAEELGSRSIRYTILPWGTENRKNTKAHNSLPSLTHGSHPLCLCVLCHCKEHASNKEELKLHSKSSISSSYFSSQRKGQCKM